MGGLSLAPWTSSGRGWSAPVAATAPPEGCLAAEALARCGLPAPAGGLPTVPA